MRALGSSFVAGLLFGVGLVVSGMTNADKVISFLDIGGDWDPSLGLVMVGAIAVHAVAYFVVRRQQSPIFDAAFRIPSRTDLTPRLIGGSALFGVGWAMGGFCPGPGLVGMMSFGTDALVFVVGLLAGFIVFRWGMEKWTHRQHSGVVEPEEHPA